MEPRISLVTLGVADLARSRHLYVEGLGWPVSIVAAQLPRYSRTTRIARSRVAGTLS